MEVKFDMCYTVAKSSSCFDIFKSKQFISLVKMTLTFEIKLMQASTKGLIETLVGEVGLTSVITRTLTVLCKHRSVYNKSTRQEKYC